MSSEGNKATVFELVDELMRSWWTVIAAICVGIAGGLVALHYSPKIYSAATTVRIAPPQISKDLLRSTVTEDMARRLLAVQDAILSRPYMEKLIDETGGRPADEVEMQAQIDRLRSNVEVATDRRARMFSLTYRDSDPVLARDIVNKLTTLYVQANADDRSSQAGATVETFDTLVATARQEFEAAERKLNSYLVAHPFETEKYLEFNQREKQSRRSDLAKNRTLQADVSDRLRKLRERMAQGNWDTDIVSDASSGDPLIRRIRVAKDELEQLRARYTESHPAVDRAERALNELMRQARERQQTGGEPGEELVPFDPTRVALQNEIDMAARELSGLQATEARLQREIAEIERKIRVTPDVQRDLTELQNAYDVAHSKLGDLTEKRGEARESEFLEQSAKGERLEVLEWAVVPVKPVSPEPPRVFAVALAAGLLLFVGPVIVRRLLNPLVKSEAGLRGITEIPVLVSLPRLPTSDSLGISRRRLLKNISLSALASAVLAFVVWTVGMG